MIWFMIAGSEIRGIHLRAREKSSDVSEVLNHFSFDKSKTQIFSNFKTVSVSLIIEFWVLYRVSALQADYLLPHHLGNCNINWSGLKFTTILSASWNFLLNCLHEFYICFIFQVQRFFFVCLNKISSSLFPSLYLMKHYSHTFLFQGKK